MFGVNPRLQVAFLAIITALCINCTMALTPDELIAVSALARNNPQASLPSVRPDLPCGGSGFYSYFSCNLNNSISSMYAVCHPARSTKSSELVCSRLCSSSAALGNNYTFEFPEFSLFSEVTDLEVKPSIRMGCAPSNLYLLPNLRRLYAGVSYFSSITDSYAAGR